MNDFPLASLVESAAAVLFMIAIVHTFSTKFFEHLAHVSRSHAGLWHLLGEVEAVFGFWALILLLFMAVHLGPPRAVGYLEGLNFTEPAFVFVVMVIAASRPVLEFSGACLRGIARLLPLPQSAAYYLTALSVGPLLGSFITEPAAMTLCALLLRDRYFAKDTPTVFKYATIGVLFVNISIGGTLTPYAAPPVLMVAGTWGWDTAFMMATFGWKAALAVIVNAAAVTAIFHRQLLRLADGLPGDKVGRIPAPVIFVHLAFLAGVVVFSHHAVVFSGLFLFFLGFTEAYKRYQSRLILREGLLVAFFLAGLVTLGSMQKWWLQPVLSGLSPEMLYFGATALTSITDNAALTYLGSLVEGVDDAFKYALVAGAVTGGGLTIIANAPNPAGFAILKGNFDEGAISPLGLLAAALPPTLIAILAFQLLPNWRYAMTEPATNIGFYDWLLSLPPEFAFLLLLPFLVATAGLLRVGLFRDKSIADKDEKGDTRPNDKPRPAVEKPVVYLKTPVAAESESGDASSERPLRDGTLKRGAAS
ncbi:MAG: putative Na+/H+ antiporter [Rhodospirillales bacterium]|nr:putative Na+/H+ antiporter [Rhodospirillales bacterium]